MPQPKSPPLLGWYLGNNKDIQVYIFFSHWVIFVVVINALFHSTLKKIKKIKIKIKIKKTGLWKKNLIESKNETEGTREKKIHLKNNYHPKWIIIVPACQPRQSECLLDSKFLVINILKQIWITIVPLCQPRQSMFCGSRISCGEYLETNNGIAIDTRPLPMPNISLPIIIMLWWNTDIVTIETVKKKQLAANIDYLPSKLCTKVRPRINAIPVIAIVMFELIEAT